MPAPCFDFLQTHTMPRYTKKVHFEIRKTGFYAISVLASSASLIAVFALRIVILP